MTTARGLRAPPVIVPVLADAPALRAAFFFALRPPVPGARAPSLPAPPAAPLPPAPVLPCARLAQLALWLLAPLPRHRHHPMQALHPTEVDGQCAQLPAKFEVDKTRQTFTCFARTCSTCPNGHGCTHTSTLRCRAAYQEHLHRMFWLGTCQYFA